MADQLKTQVPQDFIAVEAGGCAPPVGIPRGPSDAPVIKSGATRPTATTEYYQLGLPLVPRG